MCWHFTRSRNYFANQSLYTFLNYFFAFSKKSIDASPNNVIASLVLKHMHFKEGFAVFDNTRSLSLNALNELICFTLQQYYIERN